MREPDHIESTRQAYDHSAQLYVEHLGTELSTTFETTLDRAVLDAFADDVLAAGGGPVLDIGCGPGRATAYLAGRGLTISGIDLAPAMVEAAQAAHPALSFEVGSLTGLPVLDHSLAAVVSWYSIIHTPLDQLALAWLEIHRTLVPGGRALIAFQAGTDQPIVRPDAYGSAATLTRYEHSIERIGHSLDSAGFQVTTRLWRAAELAHETSAQAIVIARAARADDR